MTPKKPSPEESTEPKGGSWQAPLNEERRLYRPEERSDEKRPVITDWASI